MELDVNKILKINQALAENETILVELIVDSSLNVNRLFEITNITLDGVSCVVEYRSSYGNVDYDFDINEITAVYKEVGPEQIKLFDLV